MKKFRGNSFKIEEFEVIKETKFRLTYIAKNGKEYTEAKTGKWCSWYDSKEEAINDLVSIKERKIKALEEEISNIRQL